MKKLKMIFRELKNYFFLRSVLRKESANINSLWNKYNLRKNWYGRIYTVISLREEEMGEEELVRNWLAMEKMKPVNQYLTDLGLQEIIFPSIEKIPESRSYLVVYSPLFENLSISWVVSRLIIILLVTVASLFIINTVI